MVVKSISLVVITFTEWIKKEAIMPKSYNIERRRQGALDRLGKYKFFEKKNKTGEFRSKERWEEKRKEEISTLKKRLRIK
jgi:hypothetical protein